MEHQDRIYFARRAAEEQELAQTRQIRTSPKRTASSSAPISNVPVSAIVQRRRSHWRDANRWP